MLPFSYQLIRQGECMDYSDIGKRLKELIKENNIVQKDLADAIGVHRSYISGIIHGKRVPIDTLSRICDYIGISLSEFFRPFSEEQPESFSPALKEFIKQSKKLSDSQIKLLVSVASNFKQEIPIISEREKFSMLSFADSSDLSTSLNTETLQKNLTKSLPVTEKTPLHPVGKAAAGSALYDDIAEEKMVEIPAKYLDFDRYFSIEVKGDSMEPQLFDGDIVIVAKNVLPSPGQTALVHINNGDVYGGYLIKRYYPMPNNSVKLVSYNEKYNPICLECSQIADIQLVVFSVRNYK
ncbi:MAG: XRE family transcriptional regulator [Christensenellales bacterium]|jgi:repressor LexA